MSAAQDRMMTGISGLDRLLEGGLIRGNSLLVEGPPGSGKTTFGVRIVAEGARSFDEPGLVISFEEFPRQIYEEAAAYGIDLADLEAQGRLRVIWTPPKRILEGFTGQNDLVDSIVSEMGIRRIVIDSITHFKRVADSEQDLREILAGMLNWLKIRGVNAILVKELERQDDSTIAFEEYLVDASLRLHNAPSARGGENTRLVEVRKTRGQGHISGKHPFVLSRQGLVVHPRLRPRDVTLPAVAPESARLRVTTGVSGLDEMLDGGFWRGSVNLVSGYQGTGKSVLSAHFVDAAVRRGDAALFVSFHRDESQILSDAASLGLDWRPSIEAGLLQVKHFDLVGQTTEAFLNEILLAFTNDAPAAFVLDSLNDLVSLARDGQSIRDDVMVLTALLRAHRTTSLLLERAARLAGHAGEGEQDFGETADCFVQLVLAESEGRLQRYVGIRKHSGSDHAKELRELNISRAGMEVALDRTRHCGVLSGVAQRGYEDPVEEVMPRVEKVLEAFREVLGAEAPTDEWTKKLREARTELVLADAVLREHFGITEFHRIAQDEKPDGAPGPEGIGNNP